MKSIHSGARRHFEVEMRPARQNETFSAKSNSVVWQKRAIGGADRTVPVECAGRGWAGLHHNSLENKQFAPEGAARGKGREEFGTGLA
jgi:hypothetical protein